MSEGVDYFTEVLVPDMWVLIFAEVLTLAPRRQVWNMSQVSKAWRAILYSIIDGWFAALRRKACAVDASCKMLYPRKMLALQQEMTAFCLDLGMTPAEVLCYVRPAWFMEEQSGETLRRLKLLKMMNPRDPTRRHYHDRLPDIILEHHGFNERFRILMGPLLFDGEEEEEDVKWNTYLLGLFLHCDKGMRGFKDCGPLALEHFGKQWDVVTSTISPPWLLFFKGEYDNNKELPMKRIKNDLEAGHHVLSPQLRDMLLSQFHVGLFLGCRTVHQFVRLAMTPEQQAYMNSILPPVEPEDEDPPLTWYDIFPDPATLTPHDAAGLYVFARQNVQTHCPNVYTEEVKRALIAAMHGISV
jgi:hypothetical protein